MQLSQRQLPFTNFVFCWLWSILFTIPYSLLQIWYKKKIYFLANIYNNYLSISVGYLVSLLASSGTIYIDPVLNTSLSSPAWQHCRYWILLYRALPDKIVDILSSGNRCPPVPTVYAASPSTRLTEKGSKVFFTCQTGYKFADGTKTKAIDCDSNTLTWTLYDVMAGCVREYNN